MGAANRTLKSLAPGSAQCCGTASPGSPNSSSSANRLTKQADVLCYPALQRGGWRVNVKISNRIRRLFPLEISPAYTAYMRFTHLTSLRRMGGFHVCCICNPSDTAALLLASGGHFSCSKISSAWQNGSISVSSSTINILLERGPERGLVDGQIRP